MDAPTTNPYLELTREFNLGRTRAVLCGGPAVVLHRLAVAGKDGDWVLREDAETSAHVLDVLDAHGARYRFGAPLDVRWLSGGWSSHLGFRSGPLRIRTDFFTRPPRVEPRELEALWSRASQEATPFVDAKLLAATKLTNREKDYAVVGELARLMVSAEDRLRWSRSARDLIDLCSHHAAAAARLAPNREAVARAMTGDGARTEAALDSERRALIHANERRLARYSRASAAWAAAWPAVEREIAALPLRAAHRVVAARAEGVLPTIPEAAP